MSDIKTNVQALVDDYIENRRCELLNFSNQGEKIISYATRYAPLELFEASGAHYIGWEALINLYGCPPEYVRSKIPDQYFPTDFCTYSRFNFILRLKEPRPKISRLYGVYTCDPITKMYEYLEEVYPLHHINLPRVANENSLKFWHAEICQLKKDLEILTKNEINTESLGNAIRLENEIREKLKDLYIRKTNGSSSLSASQLFRIFSLRYYMEAEEYLGFLKRLSKIVERAAGHAENSNPKICLLGPALIEEPAKAMGETFAGAEISLFLENLGVNPIEEPWREIIVEEYHLQEDNDPLKFLAMRYYEFPKYACMIPNFERSQRNLELAKTFGATGAIYFNYRGCRVFLAESKMHENIFTKEGLKFLHLQISGEKTEVEQLKTRIESFLYEMGSG